MDWPSRSVRELTHETAPNYAWRPAIWSRDGRYIFALRSNAGDTDSSVYRIDVTSGKAEELTPHRDQIMYHVTSVSQDGGEVLIDSNEKRGFSNVALLDVASRKLTWVTDLQWDAQAGAFSPGGDRFTYGVNKDGRTELYIVDRSSMRAARIDFPPGISSFAGSPTAFSAVRRPVDCFASGLSAAG